MTLANIEFPAAVHAIAVVIGDVGHDTYLLDLDGTPLGCKRAASCLLKPETGDRVLVSGPSRQQSYLIAVLERDSRRTARLGIDGALDIACTGALRMDSQESVAITAPEVALQPDRLDVRAAEALIHVEDLTYCGSRWQGVLGVMRHTGQVLETVVDRFKQALRLSQRQVMERETVRAGHLDVETTGFCRVHGGQVMVTGQDLVKVDSTQIHLG